MTSIAGLFFIAILGSVILCALGAVFNPEAELNFGDRLAGVGIAAMMFAMLWILFQ